MYRATPFPFLLQNLTSLVSNFSIQSHRTCASSFLTFAALPSTRRGFQVECPPRTATEKALALRPSGLPKSDGWFRQCAAGGDSSSSASAGGGPTSQPALLLLLPASGSSFGPSGSAYAGATAGAEAPLSECSEYSARLGELVYVCCHHALVFLLTVSPQVGPGLRSICVASCEVHFFA